jgi:hypothetical protein
MNGWSVKRGQGQDHRTSQGSPEEPEAEVVEAGSRAGLYCKPELKHEGQPLDWDRTDYLAVHYP